MRRIIGSGWFCDKCSRSLTDYLSVSDPESYTVRESENLKRLSLAEYATLGWPGPYERTSEDIWAELDAIEDAYLRAYGQADIRVSEAYFDALGSIDVSGDDERGDEVS